MIILCSLQKLKVVPVEKKSYGKFHTGDSYIVLQVAELLILSDQLPVNLQYNN